MSVSYIPESVKIRLWGKAAGRCQYEGCNTPLWLDSLTQIEFNTAYIAHIIADRSTGPRGHETLSEELKSDISNLMLMCDKHHRLIDHEDILRHPVERLKLMKESHERRIEIVTGILPEKQSHILLYGANVGEHTSPVNYRLASNAMLPDWYPAQPTPLMLGTINSSFTDRTDSFWAVEREQLQTKFAQLVRPQIQQKTIQHLSIFALAPQPLLILLGYLLSDLPAAEVYQLHREPPNWQWQIDPEPFNYIINEPSEIKGPPALIFSLSATITNERIAAVMKEKPTIWRVTVPAPHNDFLKSRYQAQRFRQQMRGLLDRIKEQHGESTMIHIFPAMPVSLAIDFGRIIMPKADLPLKIYDQNNKLGGFVHALDIDTHLVKGQT